MSSLPGRRRLFSILFVAIAIGFLVSTIARNARDLEQFPWSVAPGGLLLSIIALVAVFIWGVFVWSRVLASFTSERVAFPSLVRIWFLSSLARYIPGKVWQFLAAGQLARAAELPVSLLLTSMLVQMMFGLLAALIVAAATVPLETVALAGATGWIAAAIGSIAILLVHPAVINLGLRLIPRVLNRNVLAWNGTWADGIGLVLLSILSWLFQGFAFFLFVDSIASLPLSSALPLTGVNAFSFAAGYLVFVAPAGLGVREATMALLLSPYAPDGVAAVVAILSRLWTVAAEVAGALLALAWTGRRSRRD